MTTSDPLDVWYRALVQTAAVAGVFLLAVCALLAVNAARGRTGDLIAANQVLAMKAQLARQPKDEALKVAIRERDLQVRAAYFRRIAFVRHGALLFVGGAAFLLLALHGAGHLRRRLPCPGTADPQAWRAHLVASRRAVALGGAAVGVLLGVLAIGSSGDIATRYTAAFAPVPAAASDLPTAEEFARHWPLFRGPGGSGVVTGALPTAWDGKTKKGILWKAPISLPGRNSPIVWGDRVFLTGATATQRAVYCFDAATGARQWAQLVPTTGAALEHVMEDTGYAAPTMATNGRQVFAIFATGDVVSFDFAGKRLWQRNLGTPESLYGYAASLAVAGTSLFVQYDQGGSAEDGKSRLYALDTATGKTRWEVERPVPNSWSSPVLITANGRDALITCGAPLVIAYNPKDGKELWRAECLGGDVAPSPIFAGGLVYACNTGANLAAIKPDGTGDVTKDIVWMSTEGLPDITSPVSDGKIIVLVGSYGIVTCLDAKTGATLWEHDYAVEFRASPLLAGNRLYLLDRAGTMHMCAAAPAFKDLGTAALGEATDASPAAAGGKLYLRGEKNLYCVGGG